MKREDVKNKIPGITEEQLNWIMQENGNDVNREKSPVRPPTRNATPSSCAEATSGQVRSQSRMA